MVNKTTVPERVLSKIAKGSDNLEVLCRECRRASEAQVVARAEKALATSFLLEIYGRSQMGQLGVTEVEANALAALASGVDYIERHRVPPEQFAKPYTKPLSYEEQNKRYFAEQDKKSEG